MRWVGVPDLQCPDHDAKALKSVIKFLEYLEPDGIVCVGDELDSPEPSRWNKGYAGEYADTLQESIDSCHDILGALRATTPGPFHLMRSNHGERIRTYLQRYAPALSGLRALDYSTLLGLEGLGITYHEQPFEFAPGWLLAHGDEGSSTQTAGGTALSLAKKWGKSVLAGHTHKAGIQHQHLTVNSKVVHRLFGMEIGHLMDMKKADYLKAGSANWQQAIAIIDVEGKNVVPTLVPIFNSTVVWDGKSYG